MGVGKPAHRNQRRATAGAARTRRAERLTVRLPGLLAAAFATAIAAFALYRATLLPGFDFGDTGSFQTMVGSPFITPRDGYPLYFAIGNAVVWLARGDPARALNLASAIEGAIACGLLVVLAAELSGSIVAAIGAGLLFAVSYTFWSQAIIAEVYALHAVFLALTLLLLLWWAKRPTTWRLALFFATYALGFGNHLSMILLAPGYTAFLLLSASGGWRSMFAPRVVAIAVACAIAGAIQYTWNLRTLWFLPSPPHGLVDALQTFWFDVTKSDWRDTMVLNVPRSVVADHAAMYWFDLKQQFGLVGPVLAIAGLTQLALANWRRAMLIALLYMVNAVFAYSYNVGDAHVFYLPSHFYVALLAAPALVLAGRWTARATPIAAVCLSLYACSRAYRDFPALDRSHDDRPAGVIGALTAGLDDQRALFLTDMNWQLMNGLSYFAKVTRPEIAYARMPDVLQYAPALVADNRAIGREVVLTERARTEIVAAYGPLLPISADPRVRVKTLSEEVTDLPPGTRYALCVLKPTPDLTLNAEDLARTLRALAGGRLVEPPDRDYVAVIGISGQFPEVVAGSNFPFTTRVQLSGIPVEVRMDAWLAADTIRRMGFGHVIAARQHTLIVERGISFVAFDDDGRARRTAYRSNIFAPQARYLIREAQ